MQTNPQKVKLIILSAIVIAALLLIVSVCELISIHQMQKKVESQKGEIENLKTITEYYKNKSDDNKDFDYTFETEE